MICRAAIAVLVAIAATPAAAAQQAADRNCSDDRGVDRCSEEQQRRVRALYGVPSIEEHAAAGEEVRRIFYVDGYGRDVVLIAFVRAPGRDPTIFVHHPERGGEGRPEPLQAPVPLAVRIDVMARSENFHRSFVEPPRRPTMGSENESITICVHGWVYTMEAVDRARFRTRPTIRRKTEDACGDGPGEAYAQQLDGIARSQFPHCAALDIANYRNDATALSMCRILRGDRLAAAEVLNRAFAFTFLEGPEDARLISHLFHYEAIIDWGGEEHGGPGYEADDFWAARIRAGDERASLYFDTADGLNADRVRLTGRLSRRVTTEGEDDDRYEIATVEQIWARVNGGEWQIERATVGSWQPESVH